MDSPDHTDDDETTSYQTPFGQMMDSRNAHLDALPGKVYRDWFEQLNRASGVFAGNSVELEKHFTQFVGTQMFVSELPDDFGAEAARLLHNYLAALATLRDVMRGIHRRVWPERYAPGTDDKRTKWEVQVWTPKVDKLLSDEPTTFLVDLRNYSLHYAIPVTSMTTNWSNTGPSGPMALWNTITVDRAELLKWDGWRSKGRKYITSHDGDNVDVMTPICDLLDQSARILRMVLGANRGLEPYQYPRIPLHINGVRSLPSAGRDAGAIRARRPRRSETAARQSASAAR